MNVQQWLTTLSKNRSVSTPVIGFTGESYPLLFCAQLFSHFQREKSLNVMSLNLHEANIAQLQAQLETSFLGQNGWYWIRSLDELSKQKRDEWLSYLNTYQGPHTIFFFSQTIPRASSWQIVNLPEFADKLLSTIILSWYNGNAQLGTQFIKQLYHREKNITLDNAVLLLQYGLLVGGNQEQFFNQLLPELIEPTSSLFSLSQSFFSKSDKRFFKQWVAIEKSMLRRFGLVFGLSNYGAHMPI